MTIQQMAMKARMKYGELKSVCRKNPDAKEPDWPSIVFEIVVQSGRKDLSVGAMISMVNTEAAKQSQAARQRLRSRATRW
jgi:hypothetical protein